MTKKVITKKAGPIAKKAPAKKAPAAKKAAVAKKAPAVKKAAEKKPAEKKTRKYAPGEHPGSVAGVRAKADDIISLGGTIARSVKTRSQVDGLKLPATVRDVSAQLTAGGLKTPTIAIRWYILRDYLNIQAAA